MCDLVQTYGIFDYKQYSCKLIATLVSGLGGNSRIARIESGAKASEEAVLLAYVADYLGCIAAFLMGREMPNSLFEILAGHEQKKEKETPEYQSYNSIEEFMTARYGD